MATYHVSLAGSNTSPYDTWAKAATNHIQVLALALTDGDIILVSPGTYPGPLGTYCFNLNLGRHDNISIIGSVIGETIGVESSRDTVIFEADSGQDCFRTVRPGLTVENCTLKSDEDKLSMTCTTNCSDLHIKNVRTSSGIYLTEAVDFIFDRLVSDAENVIGYAFNSRTTSSGVLYYPVFTGGGKYSKYAMLLQSTSGIVNIINGFVSNTDQFGISHGGAGTVNIYNIALVGCGLNLEVPTIKSTGTMNVYNLAVTGGDLSYDDFIDGATIESGIIENPRLNLNSFSREGYIVPGVDDAGRFTYAEDLANVLDTYGYKGTFYLQGGSWEAQYTGFNADLRAMVASGIMEVANHSWSHSPAPSTVGMTISYTGSDSNPTIALVAGTPRNIELRTTEGNDDTDINLTTYPTFGDIETVIGATPNWSVLLGANVTTLVKETSLDVVGAQAAPYELLFLKTDDTEGYYKDECVDSRIYINGLINGAGDVTDGQTGETYVCNSFANPYTFADVGYRLAVKAAGHTNERVNSTRGALASLDHFAIITTSIQQIVVNDDKAATTRKALALAQDAMVGGKVVFLYAHSTDEATMIEWGWVLDAFAEFANLNVTSAQLAIADILDKADSYDEPTGISVRSFTPQTDFSLKSGSECIDAGLNTPLSGVADILDMAGNIITNGAGVVVAAGGIVDIGAFEYIGIFPSDIEIIKPKRGFTFSIIPSE